MLATIGTLRITRGYLTAAAFVILISGMLADGAMAFAWDQPGQSDGSTEDPTMADLQTGTDSTFLDMRAILALRQTNQLPEQRALPAEDGDASVTSRYLDRAFIMSVLWAETAPSLKSAAGSHSLDTYSTPIDPLQFIPVYRPTSLSAN